MKSSGSLAVGTATWYAATPGLEEVSSAKTIAPAEDTIRDVAMADGSAAKRSTRAQRSAGSSTILELVGTNDPVSKHEHRQNDSTSFSPGHTYGYTAGLGGLG